MLPENMGAKNLDHQGLFCLAMEFKASRSSFPLQVTGSHLF
jgi:hypothetical protein